MSETETPSSPHWVTKDTYVAVALVLLLVLLLTLPMPTLDLIVKLVVGLSWPLVVLIAAFWFRPEISAKLRDLSEIGKGVAKFSAQAQPQGTGDPAFPGPIASDIGTSEGVLTGPVQPLRPEDTVAPVYKPFIASIAAKVDERLPAAQEASGRPAAELLRVWACDSAAALFLERASRHVFKSQLDALDGLKSAPSVTVSDFKPYYDRTQAMQYNYPFESWFGFLKSFELIVVSGDTVQITEAGRVLSHYMAERGYGRGIETN